MWAMVTRSTALMGNGSIVLAGTWSRIRFGSKSPERGDRATPRCQISRPPRCHNAGYLVMPSLHQRHEGREPSPAVEMVASA